MAWMFVGFWLLMLGTLLNMLGVIEELATFLAVAGLVYRQGRVTDEEFKTQLSAERANDLAVLKRLH